MDKSKGTRHPLAADTLGVSRYFGSCLHSCCDHDQSSATRRGCDPSGVTQHLLVARRAIRLVAGASRQMESGTSLNGRRLPLGPAPAPARPLQCGNRSGSWAGAQRGVVSMTDAPVESEIRGPDEWVVAIEEPQFNCRDQADEVHHRSYSWDTVRCLTRSSDE